MQRRQFIIVVKLIELAQIGELDPERMRELVVQSLPGHESE
jgi:hypothetical protein